MGGRPGFGRQCATIFLNDRSMSRLQFQLKTRDGRARRGRLTFPRGTVETPAFMPVGTYGSVKGILPDQVRALGAEIILGNTFHLCLRPGLDIIAAPRRPARFHAAGMAPS